VLIAVSFLTGHGSRHGFVISEPDCAERIYSVPAAWSIELDRNNHARSAGLLARLFELGDNEAFRKAEVSFREIQANSICAPISRVTTFGECSLFAIRRTAR
jgi:hypothetical protein